MSGHTKNMTKSDVSLFEAAKRASPEGIERSLAAGGSGRARDEDGWTPLHALSRPQLKGERAAIASCIQLLVDAGCDINAVAYNGQTALTQHSGMRNLLIIEALIDHGACLTGALTTAARYGSNSECVKILLAAGANPEECDIKTGKTPLEEARDAWGGADPATVALLENALLTRTHAEATHPAHEDRVGL